MSETIDVAAVGQYLAALQGEISEALAAEDGEASFREDVLPGERGGTARPRVLDGGAVFERAAVHFSHTVGAEMPGAGSARRPVLAGAAFEAVSVSMIVHPRNPHVPTMHANLRLFRAGDPDAPRAWWFGGGFDLTPYYPYEADAVAWHREARDACSVLGPEAYPRLKAWCDEYFYLPHRGETRGVGGIFFDDLVEPDFATCFRFVRRVGKALMAAYLPIVRRRKAHPYGERERDFQRYRRGRYVEFNLLYDRGTKFGLEAGGRTESILASMPPDASWRYDWRPTDGTPEARLAEFLRPRDWLA